MSRGEDMRLFVIGNRFDLAHNMNTRHSDFRDYLEDEELLSVILKRNMITGRIRRV
ncbi:AbiH family protein [Dethiosulfatibacter aminovorans]|uniref:AbiH family protein n=1 Tax=Dethiosulfatibacter aminovorans TaxID=332095 RepID=UPI000B9C6641